MQTTYLPPAPGPTPPPPVDPPLVGPRPPEPAPPPKKRPVVRAAALAALLAVAAGVGGVAGAVVTENDGGTSPAAATIARDGAPVASTAVDGSVEAAATKIAPSVVTIEVRSSGGPFGAATSATGSGVVLRADGHILTNNHVVASAADGGTIEVTFSDGRTATARIVGRDPSTDLAVIKAATVSGLTPATFADSAQLRIGQNVLAVGAPLGLSNTVTSGIVSAVNRPVRTGQSGVDPQSAVIDAVQTDAPINPGNSGGPLVDLSGRVVGINSAIATVGDEGGAPGQSEQAGNIGVGFAIPANDAVSTAEQLIDDGSAQHASLGVQASDAEDGSGAVIQRVTAGSPADEAGLRAGDVVTAVGDRQVRDVDSLVVAIRDHRPGDQVEIIYRRNDAETRATVTLTSTA